MDECSLGAATMVGELKDGQISEYDIHPEDFGMQMQSNRAIKVETPEQSLAMLKGVLDNQAGPAKEIVVLNAGLVLYASGVASTMKAGMDRAREAIENGTAKAKLEQVLAFTQALPKAA